MPALDASHVAGALEAQATGMPAYAKVASGLVVASNAGRCLKEAASPRVVQRQWWSGDDGDDDKVVVRHVRFNREFISETL